MYLIVEGFWNKSVYESKRDSHITSDRGQSMIRDIYSGVPQRQKNNLSDVFICCLIDLGPSW